LPGRGWSAQPPFGALGDLDRAAPVGGRRRVEEASGEQGDIAQLARNGGRRTAIRLRR
jgi:hypothetical protein